MWVRPSDVVTSVRLMETAVQDCDPNIQPQYDAVFQIARDGEINATVGRSTTGFWVACPAY
jgi:hypothetical protein